MQRTVPGTGSCPVCAAAAEAAEYFDDYVTQARRSFYLPAPPVLPMIICSIRCLAPPPRQILVDDLRVWCRHALGPAHLPDGRLVQTVRVGSQEVCRRALGRTWTAGREKDFFF